VALVVATTFEITIEPNLNTKSYCQSNSVAPELKKLILGKTPNGNQRGKGEIDNKEY